MRRWLPPPNPPPKSPNQAHIEQHNKRQSHQLQNLASEISIPKRSLVTVARWRAADDSRVVVMQEPNLLFVVLVAPGGHTAV